MQSTGGGRGRPSGFAGGRLDNRDGYPTSKEFGKKLWSDDVYIIDPCTGTGNFIVNLIRRIPKAKLEAVYRERLFANEIMLLPYYIAALNIEHERMRRSALASDAADFLTR